MTLDLVVRNGLVVDGTGSPGVEADVGVTGGRIVAVGDVEECGTQEVDASERVVAPGFIDIHTHYDVQLAWDRMATVSPWHGVTTVVMGGCGFGIAPTHRADRQYILQNLQHVEGMNASVTTSGMGDWGFETFPEYLEWVDTRNPAVNVVAVIGHSAVRRWVLGDEALRPEVTRSELDAMRAVVAEAMSVGAVGFSTSLSLAHTGEGGLPVPSRTARMDELVALVAVLGDVGVGTFQPTGGPATTLDVLRTVLEKTGVPISGGLSMFSRSGVDAESLTFAREMQADGQLLLPQYPVLPTTFEVGLDDPFMFALDLPKVAMGVPSLDELFVPVMALGSRAEREAVYRTHSFRVRFVELTSGPDWTERYWPFTVINYAPSRPDLEGKTIVDSSHGLGVAPAELMIDLTLASGFQARFGVQTLADDPELRLELMLDDTARIGASDAGAHVAQLCDSRYPTVVLGRYVRELGLPLERAVQLLTTMEAESFGIADRGRLEPGLAADLVVFDPRTIDAGPLQRVDDLPGGGGRLIADATGIDRVIVNGTVVRADGHDALDPSDPLPGGTLRSFERIADRRARMTLR